MKNFRRTLGFIIITLLTFVPFVTPAVASTPTQQVGTVSIRVAPYLNGDVKNFAYINSNMPNKPYDGCMLYVYVDLPGGGGWDQDISSVGETEIEVTSMGGSPVGAINITVRKKCPKVDIVVASARPLVAFAQETFKLWGRVKTKNCVRHTYAQQCGGDGHVDKKWQNRVHPNNGGEVAQI